MADETTQQVAEADAPVTAPEPELAPTGPVEASPEPAGARPVTVNQFTVRSDADPQEGSEVQIVAGDHAGQRGAFVKVESYDPQTGYPVAIVVKIKDATYTEAVVSVPYDDVRPAVHPGHQ